jgi:hypothetical protein
MSRYRSDITSGLVAWAFEVSDTSGQRFYLSGEATDNFRLLLNDLRLFSKNLSRISAG